MPAVHLSEPGRRYLWKLARNAGGAAGIAMASALASECPTLRGFAQSCPCHLEESDVTNFVHPTATVEGRVGTNCTIGAHAWIGRHAQIGNGCTIGPGASIGHDGFGYINNIDGSWVQKPQSAGVVIGDDVHVGANTCIDRGSYRDTTIGRGSKIDNLVHVGHNVIIGADCLIIAQTMLGGSVVIGDQAYIAPCVSVRDHINIGAGAFVGMGAVVVADVEPGQQVKGVPAKEFQRRAA